MKQSHEPPRSSDVSRRVGALRHVAAQTGERQIRRLGRAALLSADDVIDLALEIKLDGLVATNTTISRKGVSHQSAISNQQGGLSGLPLKQRSTEIVKYIFEKTNGELPIIASGGIFTRNDAKEKMEAGASLVQVWTGFIYEGPGIVKRICKELELSNR